VLLSLVLSGIAFSTLWWMLHAWRHTNSLQATGFAPSPEPPRRSFSLLVPARHEEEVLGHTLATLARSDHPDFEIVVIIGHDDPGTEAVAREAELRYPDLVRVVIDDSVPKNKPRGMNTALPHCRGDVIGVFDAEDEVHPDLLRLVDGRFTETGADIVQGGVQLMNVRSTWWSLRNCLEYYFWFRSRLHFHAEARFIPLGGNTVFVRAEMLRAAGGWDGDCLAEDCELGVRLSTAGAKVAVAYDPRVVTREETPGSLRALVKQRTRWSQGFLQVLGKGAWRDLPTHRQRVLARYTLAMPFLQAFSGLMIPLSVVLMLFVKVPVPVALITFLPLIPTLVTLSVETAGLGDFGRSYGIRIRSWDRVRLVLGTFPYQVLLAFAALRAVWREVRGDSSWEKTAHAGAHINPASTSQEPDVLARAHAHRERSTVR
jgi:cellulose synthase/poly-beta-1,6-N-acetylglucosamine synthase-like glycosyltransferase